MSLGLSLGNTEIGQDGSWASFDVVTSLLVEARRYLATNVLGPELSITFYEVIRMVVTHDVAKGARVCTRHMMGSCGDMR